MVASNEFEEAWLDEGINSYTEVKVLAALLGPGTSAIRQRYANLGDGSLQRDSYLSSPDSDPVTRFAWKFRNENSYGAVTYGKTATLLATLEGILGTSTMDEAMRTYFERYRFTHPTTEDFLRTIEQVAVAHGKAKVLSRSRISEASESALPCSPIKNHPASPASPASTTTFSQLSPFVPAEPVSGAAPPCTPSANPAAPSTSEPSYAPTTLRPFFNQAVYGTEVLDYAVGRFSSEPVRWWEPAPRGSSKRQYLSTVTLRRKGDFILPVTAEIIFNDGNRVREHWDGADRWTRFTYTRNAKVVSVEIDPDHLIPLDRDLFNNSDTDRTDKVPAHKLASILVVFQQMVAQLAAWIV
jgi:hypothetical protein